MNNVPVFFVVWGDWTYLNFALKSLRLHSPDTEVHVIGTEDHSKNENLCRFHEFKSLHHDYFRDTYCHDGGANSREFEANCILRWPAVGHVTTKLGIDRFILLDHDCLVFQDLNKLAQLYADYEYAAAELMAPPFFVNNLDFVNQYWNFAFERHQAPFTERREFNERYGSAGEMVLLLLTAQRTPTTYLSRGFKCLDTAIPHRNQEGKLIVADTSITHTNHQTCERVRFEPGPNGKVIYFDLSGKPYVLRADTQQEPIYLPVIHARGPWRDRMEELLSAKPNTIVQ